MNEQKLEDIFRLESALEEKSRENEKVKQSVNEKVRQIEELRNQLDQMVQMGDDFKNLAEDRAKWKHKFDQLQHERENQINELRSSFQDMKRSSVNKEIIDLTTRFQKDIENLRLQNSELVYRNEISQSKNKVIEKQI